MNFDAERTPDEQRQETDDEVLRRNIEQSRELIEAKRRHREEEVEAREGGRGPIERPPRDDPRFSDQSVAPGQPDTPAGGSSGSEENLGGGYKKKPGR